jgi:hypothetical protein
MQLRPIRTLAAGVAGAALAYFLDPAQGRRRRHVLRDRTLAIGRRSARRAARRRHYAASLARGKLQRTEAALRNGRHEYDDVTLAHKVETEIFRPADAPKGSVSVNAHDGVVELRGQLERQEEIERLVQAAAAVEGVARVENLLHTPGQPARHAPVSEPDEVRRRAAEPLERSNFAGNPATTRARPGADTPPLGPDRAG